MDVLELVAQMQMSREVKPSAFSVPENKITTNMEEKENE